MRLLVFLAHTKPYGGERVAIDLARGATAEGHHVDYVAYYADEGTDPAALLGPDVVYRSLHRRGRSVASMITSIRRLRALLRETRPDALVSLMPAANLIAALATIGIRSAPPLVMTEHSIASVSLSRGWSRPQSVYVWLVRILYQRAAAVVAVSRAVGDDISQLARLPAHRVHVIPNPVDAARVRSRASEYRPKVPWGDDAIMLVSVAGLNYAKRPLLLLDVFQRLPPSYRLVMVGDGPMAGSVHGAIMSRGLSDRVLLTGWLDNPHPWMAAADALVLFSGVEGFGLVVAEAAALGVPAVTAAAGGLKETTVAAGGRVVDSDDPVEMAAAIEDVVAHPPAVTFAEPWHPEVAIARYLRLFSEVASTS